MALLGGLSTDSTPYIHTINKYILRTVGKYKELFSTENEVAPPLEVGQRRAAVACMYLRTCTCTWTCTPYVPATLRPRDQRPALGPPGEAA